MIIEQAKDQRQEIHEKNIKKRFLRFRSYSSDSDSRNIQFEVGKTQRNSDKRIRRFRVF